MGMQRNNSLITQIADACAHGLGTTKTANGSLFLKKLNVEYVKIQKARNYFSETYKLQKKSEIPETEEWLFDNFYLIENEYETCVASLKKAKRIPISNNVPRISAAFSAFTETADFPLSETAVQEIFYFLSQKYSLALNEYFFASALIAFSLICSCAKICDDYKFKKLKGLLSKEEQYARKLENIIESMRYVLHCNFDNELLKSKVAEILSRDPAEAFLNMTDSTKIMYIKKVSELAKKANMPETDFAETLLKQAQNQTDERKRHIGYALFQYPKFPQRLYFFLLITLTVATLTPLVFVSPVFAIAFFPIWEFSKCVIDYSFSKTTKSVPLPRMKLRDISDNASVLVVITSLLLGEEKDGTLFDRLESIYRSNGGKNVFFGVLGDLKDSCAPKAPGDDKTINYAYGRIDSLNRKYGKKFILLERRRSYSKSEEVFMGWERKRGAVVELVRFLKGKKTTFDERSQALALEVIGSKRIKYVITLDSDTNLPIDCVKDMYSAMIHPLAKPFVDKNKGIVTQGYAIMQPRCAPELSAAGATPFSRIMCGEGGTNIYSFASFDIYQSVFGEGIFCGKGIFDTDVFYEVIDKNNTFPEDKILSHDCLEGAKLRSALISDIELTDGFPKHELSYLKRRHRWVRGDIQNLAYLFPKIIFSKKDYRKNNISALSKYKLADNVKSAVVPIFSFIGIFISMFYPSKIRSLLILFSLLYLIFPLISDLLSTFSKFSFPVVSRKFFSKGVTVGIWQSVFRTLFNFAMLPQIALSSADAILRSLYRAVVSGKKTLEWQTAAQSDSGDGSLPMFVHKNIFCAFSGFLLFAFSPPGFLRFISLLWFSFPVTAYHTSFDKRRENLSQSREYSQKSRKYAADIWNFFKDTVTEAENYLPPDNIQLAPHESVAHRTSPTNIGLYLLSVLCARDFSFINTTEAEKRICETLTTLEKLPKYKGHLFNWYDTETLSVLPPKYISTVDSGNLTACLITLRQGLREYVSESTTLIELIKRIEELENNTDYGFLYNKNRNLFSLGAESTLDGKFVQNAGCYDLLMSEARTVSYIECAKRNVPLKHWKSLSRTLVSSKGYIGLSSWSGTAFEYFMPPIFLPIYKGSLCGEAMSFTMREQSLRRAERNGKQIFGISESGYFSFDSSMNYRYRAFGIPSLALKSGLEKDMVISPYSSFLALCIDKKKAFANLDVMKKIGLYDKYGFFESVDFTPGRGSQNGSAVKSYMSHHLGMSLCSLCNAAFENKLQKRFMSDSAMQSAKELLEEKIPVNAVIRKLKKRKDIPVKSVLKSVEGKIHTTPSLKMPNVSLLSNGYSKIIVSTSGHIKMSVGDYLINHCEFEKYYCTDSFFCFANFNGATVSCSPLVNPTQNNCEYFSKYSGGFCSNFVRLKGVCEFSQSFTIVNRNTFAIKAELTPKNAVSPNKSDKAAFCFCFTPVIAKEEEYFSHIAFSSLFLEAEYYEKEKILIYKRRPRTEAEKIQYLGVAMSDISSDFDFCTKQDKIFSNLTTPESFSEIFSASNDCSVGALIQPYCKINTVAKSIGGKFVSELLICKADSIEKIISEINSARAASFSEYSKNLAEATEKLCSVAGIGMFGSKNAPSAVEKMLYGIAFSDTSFKRVSNEKTSYIGMDKLWKYGISGDLPIIAISLISAALISKIEKYLRAAKLLRLSGIKLDLCIVYNEKERYRRPVFSEICELIAECDCTDHISKKDGGIFLIDGSLDLQSANAVFQIAVLKAEILYDSRKIQPSQSTESLNLPVTSPNLSIDFATEKEKYLSLSHGSFEKNGFTVRKDREFKAPYSHILTGLRISTLPTHSSLGYTWVSNAQNKRITPFYNSPLSDMKGEKLLLASESKIYDLCAMARYVTFKVGCAVYKGVADGIEYEVCVYVSEKLCAKYCDVKLKFPPGSSEPKKLIYCSIPIMGKNKNETQRLNFSNQSNVLTFKNPFSEFFGNYCGFIAANSECENECDIEYITDLSRIYLKNVTDSISEQNCASVSLSVQASNVGKYYRFVLGAYNDNEKVLDFTLKTAFNGEKEKNSTIKFANSLLPPIEILPKNNSEFAKSYAVLFNVFLPYQNAAARFFARSGFYQSGGAFGFRDQLQDSLCLMYSRPDLTKTHIFRCCARQFLQGDALHWWHDCSQNGSVICKGVRTLCSDDYLWLPYVVAEYFSHSGDKSFLLKRINYAKAEELKGCDTLIREKYVDVEKATEAESVYEHCKRALNRGISRLGSHSLPLIGSCDWCDGYSNVGDNFDGESVWLGMFLCMTLQKFFNVCGKMRDFDALDKYSHARLNILSAIEKHGICKNQNQYIRAYFPNGEKLGDPENDECKIDLLPQCFAPLCVPNSPDRLFEILQNAYNKLFDSEYKIFKLFSPPFKNSRQNPGYIKGYVAGIRENGGQYTHAAIWGALGLCATADILYKNKEYSLYSEMLKMAENAVNAQNPILRCSGYLGKKAKNAYFAEPYYLAGDIYSNAEHFGRSGWSIYTGSAAWYYRLILEQIFGLRFYSMAEKENFIEIDVSAPSITNLCKESVLRITPKENCEYYIEYSSGKQPQITLDGEIIVGKIKITCGTHKIHITRPENIAEQC